MSTKLKKDALLSELNAIDKLLVNLDDRDFISRKSLNYQREKLISEISRASMRSERVGRVLLAFEGGPVQGSRGIEAGFAAKIIERYQELVEKQVAARDVALARTGPVPLRHLAKMNITDVAHGSFGFQLEESRDDQLSFIDSPVHTAIMEVNDILVSFAGEGENSFHAALSKIDKRVFIGTQAFFDVMYQNSAALKLIEDDRDFTLSQNSINQARNRLMDMEIDDREIVVLGELLGLTPVSRRFDLKVDNSDALEIERIISGQVGLRLSTDYLERLHTNAFFIGRKYRAILNYRVSKKVDGSVSESFVLVDLSDT